MIKSHKGIIIASILNLLLVLSACSETESSLYNNDAGINDSGFDILTESSLMAFKIKENDIEDLVFLGVIDNCLLFHSKSDNFLHYYIGSSETQKIFDRNIFDSIISYPLQSGLVLKEVGKGNTHLLTLKKSELHIEQLPDFPHSLAKDQIKIIEQKGTLYIGVATRDALTIYSLKKNTVLENNWNELTYTNFDFQNQEFLMAIQSNGSEECLYVFLKEKGVLCYNFRQNHWTYKEIDTRFIQKTASAFARGATSIIFPQEDGQGLYVFNTVTLSFFNLESQPKEGILQKVQISGEHVVTVYHDRANSSFELRQLSIEKIKNGFSLIDIIVLILYFGFLLAIGFHFSKRQKSTNDYFRGGQRIPWWAAGLSLFGTALSAITFMAIPAKSFATNWSYMLFNSGILMVAPIIMFVFIPFFRKLNITTAYEYLEVRFNSLIRVVCSLAFMVFQLGRMGVILLLPSIAINVVTGLDIFLCIALMGVFSIIYTRMGGIEAVVWTDALQVVILLGGAVFAIFHIIGQIPGGWSETVSVAYYNGKMSLGSTVFDLSDSTMWTVLIATFFTNLTTYGTDQSMVQRYLTTSSEKAAKNSIMTNALLTIPSTIIFFLIGTALFVYYKINPADVSPLLDSNDAIFPWYAYTKLPTGIVGLLIAGIFSAAMSTLSGSMNSVATAYVIDIRPKLRKNKPEGDLKVAQKVTVIAGTLSLCFAFFMATWNINSLWDEFNKILGLILGSMGGLFLLGMITKKANAFGALVGMAVSILVQLIVAGYTSVHLLLYTTVGFITCFIVGYLASYFFKTKNRII
ncbi:MAG: sodium:solute symporter [Bacteroidales bacterium]|nr:sodium:solute symporter [Bacteroidales bacterium]